MGIEGDLRFLSHHDTMRTIERTAARAAVPVKFTQGFNPRPIYSLACPRPVGIATRDDLLVLRVEQDMPGREIVSRMNRCVPEGMTLSDPLPLKTSKTPQPIRQSYEMHLSADEIRRLIPLVDRLNEQAEWVIQRIVTRKARGRGRNRRKEKTTRELDIRPMVESLTIDTDDNRLRMVLIPQGEAWARPGEVLRLLDMDDRIDLARLLRTDVQYRGLPDPAVSRTQIE
ncbi:MAG: TIGR03936 family radical SAM-associated protein [Phycisphaerae bacterium]